MKKTYLIFPVLALLSGACTNPLEPKFDQDAEMIVLNAMLRTDDTVHVAWLSLSQVDAVERLDDAQLRCYVNGQFVAEGKPAALAQYERVEYSSKYSFRADIHPGDEVRVEASKGLLKASATARAPQAATLVSVDTSYIKESPYFKPDEQPLMSCKLKLQDLPGQPNWYRLSLHHDSDEDSYFYHEKRRYATRFGFLQDPVLQDGKAPKPKEGHGLDALLPQLDQPHTYCIFRDKPFADGTAEVEIHTPNCYNSFRGTRWVQDTLTYKPTEVEVYHLMSLEFAFLTITEEEYDYLVQLDKSLHGNNDMGVFQEPVHIPSNVEGGMGFFSVAAASKYTLLFPESR